MAINFLNSVDFNKNELLNPTIENQPNDTAAGTGVAGQLYFNTTDNILKVYAGSSWVEVGGGVTSLTTTDGTYIDLTPNSSTTGAVTVTADLSAVDGTAGAGERYLTKNNTWATVASIAGTTYDLTGLVDGGNGKITLTGSDSSQDIVTLEAGTNITLSSTGANSITIDSADQYTGTVTSVGTQNSTFISGSGGPITGSGSLTYSLSATGTPSSSTYLRGDNTWAALPADNDNYVDSVSFSASTGILTLGRTGTLADLPESLDGRYLELAGGTMTGEINMGSDKITNLLDPTNAQDAATKAYVDNLVDGGLTFKDGFNATTGAIDGGGNLTSGGTRVAISVGDYYVVTTAGDFYGDSSYPLTVGDSVIAKEDAAAGASTVTDWVIIQGDEGVVDLTSGNGGTSTGNALTSNTTARGSVTVNSFAYGGTTNVGHVPSGGSGTTFLRGDGTWVTPTNTTPNNATITLDAGTNLTGGGNFTTDQSTNETIEFNLATANGSTIGAGNVAAGTGISVAYSSGTATVTNTDTNSSNTDTGEITAGSTSGTVTHNFGTTNVIVQTYLDNATDNYPTVFCDVTRSSNSVTATIATAETDDIIILVQKIG
jgi:hypothetical protein